jgi:predicted amidophosphoribosyltransferase
MTKKTLLIPDTAVEKPIRTPKKPTPLCPNCKAKFSHWESGKMCKKCHLPDEIADLGPNMIARWRRKNGIKKPGQSFTTKKRPNKHGRRGVKK